MHKNHHGCGCCCGSNCEERIEPFVTDDGRRAEKHFKCDENGQQVVEIYAEEHRPLHLEKRVLQEVDEIVVKEIHEEIVDGNITKQDVYALEPQTELEHRQSLGTLSHDSVYKGQYVRQGEMERVIENTVSSLMANKEMSAQSANLKAQSILEKHTEKNSGNLINYVLGAVLVAQVVFFGYVFFVM